MPFLVLYEDCHIDDIYSVHRTQAGAIARAKEMREEAPARYHQFWHEVPIADWIEHWDTFDDGPKVHIEQVELKG